MDDRNRMLVTDFLKMKLEDPSSVFMSQFARDNNYSPGRLSQLLKMAGFNAEGQIIKEDFDAEIAAEAYGHDDMPNYIYQQKGIKYAALAYHNEPKEEDVENEEEEDETEMPKKKKDIKEDEEQIEEEPKKEPEVEKDEKQEPQTVEKGVQDGKKVLDEAVGDMAANTKEGNNSEGTQVIGAGTEDHGEPDSEAESDQSGGMAKSLLIGGLALALVGVAGFYFYKKLKSKKSEKKTEDFDKKFNEQYETIKKTAERPQIANEIDERDKKRKSATGKGPLKIKDIYEMYGLKGD
jgi:hypothetical protein